MSIKSINLLAKSYLLFPSETCVIRISRRSIISNLFRGLAWEREWAGLIK